jgi:hypothetical protein
VKITLGDSPTRSEVLKFLLESSQYGNLGLFVGAGFSKAIVDTDRKSIALGWGQLLTTASKRLRVPIRTLRQEGSSYPDLASRICAAHAARTGGTSSKSLLKLKRIISAATAWYPSEQKRAQFSHYLEKLAPSWIITTNYDQVLECLLPGASLSLGPDDTFTSKQGLIPIFHLHGVRSDPESLIISQEDYVALFRTNEYRQIRLAMALKESTTCLLGYSLGDVNVLTALDWSSKVYQGEASTFPREVLQIIRTGDKEPRDPYRLENGIVVVEVAELADLFDEYVESIPAWKRQQSRRKKKISEVRQLFSDAAANDISAFLEDPEWRKQILSSLPKYKIEFIKEFEGFLNRVVDHNKALSSRSGAFYEYAKGLDMILDVLGTFPCNEFPPALLSAVVRALDRLANYIGKGLGNSFSASELWEKRKSELSADMIAELRAIAACHGHRALEVLIEEL